MVQATSFMPIQLTVKEKKTWIFGALFALGNILLPQICHLIPNGGLIFLPIYFFTLIAAYKFGYSAGIITALLSPIMNHILFGMPPSAMLLIILIKSSLLAVFAATIAKKSESISLVLIALAVVSYQLIGGILEGILAHDIWAGVQDFKIGYPGLIIQIVAGWIFLKALSNYGR